MIPKIIHLIWFGKGEYPDLVKMCIDSWKKVLPDYTIMFWNEDSFDVNSTSWTKEAYESRKWAFVSDYVRVYALYNYGGVYLDTDIEVLKNFSNLLDGKKYVSCFVEKYLFGTSFIACEKKHGFIKKLLDYYSNRHFKTDKGIDQTINPLIFSIYAQEYFEYKFGKKHVFNDNESIYPYSFFCPYKKNMFREKTDKKSYIITTNTYCIHHDMGSWASQSVVKRFSKAFLRLLLPSCFYLFIKKNIFRKKLKRIEI